ncbi:MAG: HDOD domain-containing protein [Burkholderiales bacterium]
MPLSPELRTLDVDLPACPRTLLDMLVLLNDDDAPLEAMAQVIERDMALAAAVVRTVNSAMFGLLRRVDTVNEAVRFLGTREVAGITFATALRAAFPPTPQLEALWEHASRCGLLMGRCAGSLGLDPWRAHTAGLFARSGQAVLLVKSGGVYPDMLARLGHDVAALAEAEREAFGVTHTAYGSALCAAWGLAADVVKFVHERATPAHEWAPHAAPVRDLLALGALVEELLAGEDLVAAAERLAGDPTAGSAQLLAAVRGPWQRFEAMQT